jgi:hypothetical protein
MSIHMYEFFTKCQNSCAEKGDVKQNIKTSSRTEPTSAQSGQRLFSGCECHNDFPKFTVQVVSKGR